MGTIRLYKRSERILACRDVYTIADVHRHFRASYTTIRKIWETDRSAICDPPNIETKKVHPDIIRADTEILLERGWGVEEIVAHFGVRKDRVLAAIREIYRDNPQLRIKREEENENRFLLGSQQSREQGENYVNMSHRNRRRVQAKKEKRAEGKLR